MTDNDLRAIIEATREFYLLKGQDGMTCAMMVNLRQAACTDEAMEAVRARLALAAQPAAEPGPYPTLPEPDVHALLADCRGYLRSYAHAAIDLAREQDRAVAAQPARAAGDAPTQLSSAILALQPQKSVPGLAAGTAYDLGFHDARAAVAALAAAPQPAAAEPPGVMLRGIDDADNKRLRRLEMIRATFLAHGFTIKEGQTDLKPYVYEAAEALLAQVEQPAASTVPATDEVMESLLWVDDFIARCNGDDRGSCESVNVLRRALTAAPAAVEHQPLTEAECIKLLKFGQSSVEMVRRVERAHGIGISSSKEGGAGND